MFDPVKKNGFRPISGYSARSSDVNRAGSSSSTSVNRSKSSAIVQNPIKGAKAAPKALHELQRQPLQHQPYPYPYSPSKQRSSTYSRSIVDGWNESGCTVTCVAMAARVSYAEAREAAMETNGFIPNAGMGISDAPAALKYLGISSTMRSQSGGWSSLPDCAIISVEGDISDHESTPNLRYNHAVLFRRKNGREYIYDCNEYSPKSISGYTLNTDRNCVEVHEP